MGNSVVVVLLVYSVLSRPTLSMSKQTFVVHLLIQWRTDRRYAIQSQLVQLNTNVLQAAFEHVGRTRCGLEIYRQLISRLSDDN